MSLRTVGVVVVVGVGVAGVASVILWVDWFSVPGKNLGTHVGGGSGGKLAILLENNFQRKFLSVILT